MTEDSDMNQTALINELRDKYSAASNAYLEALSVYQERRTNLASANLTRARFARNHAHDAYRVALRKV